MVERTEKLKQYLKSQVEDGKTYFKSKEVADELSDFSSKQVGFMLSRLSSESDELEIEKWNRGAKSATWKINMC